MDFRQEIRPLVDILIRAERVAALTGSGISAESGIPTFRGADGLWKTYRTEDLATPSAFEKNPQLVWEWYDWRRGIMADKEPNAGHKVIARWEKSFPSFVLITQNIDGLHQKAGSTNVLELHGNIWKMRCTKEQTVNEVRDVPLKEIPPRCPDCRAFQRPHVVWFGELLNPDLLHKSFLLSASCQVLFVVGTSALVQPAASLPLAAADGGATIVEVNPDPTPLTPYASFSFHGNAGDVLPLIDAELQQDLQKRGH